MLLRELHREQIREKLLEKKVSIPIKDFPKRNKAIINFLLVKTDNRYRLFSRFSFLSLHTLLFNEESLYLTLYLSFVESNESL